ncbi:MAG: site-specific integrase [Clostridiales bacterium]|nr:site-specific integrase [Clostridiales bacterium]
MAGTITKRGNKIRLQYQCNGTRYGKTIPMMSNKEAEKELAKFIAEVEKGNFVNTTYTFYEFSQIWLSEVVQPNSSPITLRRYIGILNMRILPTLGAYKLKDINVLILNSFFNDLKTQKTMFKHRKNTPLAKSTIQKIREVINAILQKAYEFEIIPDNPCRKVRLQLDNIESELNKEEKIKCYDKETYKQVLELLKKEKLFNRVIIEIALKTGFRRSEIWGLTWDNIDFKNNKITVNKTRHYLKGQGLIIKTTKTKKSKRTIIVASSLMTLLKKYKKECKTEFLTGDHSIDTICGWFKDFQKKNNISPIRFHDLRHTHASLLLNEGVDLKTISERLGHSTIRQTMDIYTHVSKELDEKAGQIFDEL